LARISRGRALEAKRHLRPGDAPPSNR
jgi:hypothetical protein